MTKPPVFVLDSDVFIAAKNAYYAFDLCPGFWKGILRAHEQGRARSIDRVKGELLSGRKEEDLVQWVQKNLPASFFVDSNSDDVSAVYAEVMLWVQRNPQYFDRAKAKFATEADGWLVAYLLKGEQYHCSNERTTTPGVKEPRSSAGRLYPVQSNDYGHFPHA